MLPAPVYLTGRYSRRLSLLSRLPTPILDRARRRVFHLPAPGTLAVETLKAPGSASQNPSRVPK
jgi:hypothetical protein